MNKTDLINVLSIVRLTEDCVNLPLEEVRSEFTALGFPVKFQQFPKKGVQKYIAVYFDRPRRPLWQLHISEKEFAIRLEKLFSIVEGFDWVRLRN